MPVIPLLFQLLSGQDSVFGIDNNHKFPTINMRRKFRTMFASENICGKNSRFPMGLPAASMTYHLRSRVSFFAINVDISISSVISLHEYICLSRDISRSYSTHDYSIGKKTCQVLISPFFDFLNLTLYYLPQSLKISRFLYLSGMRDHIFTHCKYSTPPE